MSCVLPSFLRLAVRGGGRGDGSGLLLALLPAADPHFDHQGEGAQVHDGGDDDVGDVLVKGGEAGDLLAHDVQHGHEAAGEDHADGIAGRQQGHRDAIEAGGGQGLIGLPVELRVAGQVVQRRRRPGESPRDGHGQHDVPLVADAGVPGGVAVAAAGHQLVAHGGLGHEHIHQDGDDNRDAEAPVHLGAGEQDVQPRSGGLHPVKGGLVDVVGLAVLLQVAPDAAVKDPGHQVGGDPVGHDAGQHLVDVEQSLHQPGEGAPQRPRQNARQEGQQPHDRGGHHGCGDAQRGDQGGGGAHKVLPRGADVEQAGLEGHRHRQSGEDERGGPEQHIAHVGGVEAKGEAARGVPPGAENAAQHQPHAVPHAAAVHIAAGQACDDHDDAAHQQADEDGDHGGRHRLGPVLFHQITPAFLHATSSPSPV